MRSGRSMMVGKNKTNGLAFTILMMSLITAMTGAAVSPALGQIKGYYSDVDTVYIQMISSTPALFILMVNLLFTKIEKHFNSKTIAIMGITFYVLSGVMGGLVSNIYLLLFSRVLIGIGTGLIMPLSTGLLGYYFSSDKQGQLMGYSSAMNNIGGIVAMSLSGYLAAISWRYSFFVYLIGLLVMVMVIIVLPKAKLNGKENRIHFKDIKENTLFFIGMFLLQTVFYLFITNYAFIAQKNGIVQTNMVGMLMSVQSVGAVLMSLMFGKLKKQMGNYIRYFGIVAFGLSYLLLAVSDNLAINIIALLLNGMGFGTLMPFFNVALLGNVSKDKSVGIMSVMSASLYLGQFLSPIILAVIISAFSIEGIKFPYFLGISLSVVLLLLFTQMKGQKKRVS